jgi:8-oxo-dGTP diphosphatase
MTKPTVLVAAAALIDVDGRVLICQRPQGKQLAGLWEFPGGKVEPGETPEQCLIRELDEELGIKVAQACLAPFVFASHGYESFHLLMPLYLLRRWEGTGDRQGARGAEMGEAGPARGLSDAAGRPAVDRLAARSALSRFWRDERGATAVESA